MLIFWVCESNILELEVTVELFGNNGIWRRRDSRDSIDDFENSSSSDSALRYLLDGGGKLSEIEPSHQNREKYN